MSTTTSAKILLTLSDFEVPDLIEENLITLKGAKMIPEQLDLVLGESPQCGSSPLPEKQEPEEPEVLIIKTKVHVKQTKKKGLF